MFSLALFPLALLTLAVLPLVLLPLVPGGLVLAKPMEDDGDFNMDKIILQ